MPSELVPNIKKLIFKNKIEKHICGINDISLVDFIQNYTVKNELIIGKGKIKLKYYTNFAKTVSNTDECDALTDIFVDFLKNVMDNDDFKPFDKIAIPRRGNPHLGILIARLLRGYPCVIVGNRASLPYERFAGEVNKGEKFLIVEDIISSGKNISETVDLIRKAEGEVVQCCVLIERTDSKTQKEGKTPSEYLNEQGIKVFSQCSINDKGIENLLTEYSTNRNYEF